MKTIDYVTVAAAHNFCAKEQGKKTTAYVNMRDIHNLIHANEKKSYHQGWSFLGSKADWNRAIRPVYGS